MKKTFKTFVAVGCAALLALSLAACGKDASQAEFIGLDAAKAIALENAGVTESAAVFSTTGLDRRDGTDFYAVDFTAGGQSYEYDIDALTGTIITGPAAAGSAAPESSPLPSQSTDQDGITADQAKELALDHAGLTAAQVTFVRAQLERDDGRQVYDVEFYDPSSYTEYDYEIEVSTGAILSYDHDAEHYNPPASSAPSGSNAGTGSNSGAITSDRAKEIALNHAGLTASQVTFIRAQLEWDDGRQVYDVEFYNAGDYTEYDYEIDASSGAILSYDRDAEHYTPPASPSPSGSGTITADRAKEIALNHAGLTAGQVTFVKSKLDWDDGRQVYDVEFYDSSYTEYDYEIDASSGSILSYDFDAEGYDRPAAGTTTISADQAKQIALDRVPGATMNDIYEFELDRDDGRLEYEGTIYYNGMEYEFTIDGYSGAIREWEAEPYGR